MNTNEHEYLFKDETHRIIGCAMEVLNELGNGLHEKPYENAMVVEFQLQGIPYEQQPQFDIRYKHAIVGEFVPDLICFEEIVVDAKTIDQITNVEIGKMLNYLKITRRRMGLILNFRHARLDWKRVVL